MATKTEWKEPKELTEWKKKNSVLDGLIEDRIDNFLGYGNPKSSEDPKIWLIGMEEGANEEKRIEWYPNKTFDKNNRDKYYINWFENRKNNIKQGADKAFGDQRIDAEYYSWGNAGFPKLYELLLFLKKGERDGKYNSNKSPEEISEIKQITDNLHEETCLLEFNPIPFRKNKGQFAGTFLWTDYVKLYGPDHLGKFINYISKRRIKLIKEKIEKYHPKIVIFYGLSYNWCHIEKDIWMGKLDKKFKEKNIANYRKGKGYNLYHSTITNEDGNGRDYKTHVFIIPHCSRNQHRDYKLIGKRILEIINQ